MKTVLILLFIVLTQLKPTATIGQTSKTPVDYLSLSGPLVFDKIPYKLTWTSHATAKFYKQEYIAQGDDISKFKTMVLVDVLTGNGTVKEVVALKIAELKKLKETNPVVNYEVISNPKTGEYILDFLLSANTPDQKRISVVERNVYRYSSFTDKSGTKGILLFGVSERSYGDDVDNFFSSLKATRKELIRKVAEYKIPEVTIKK